LAASYGVTYLPPSVIVVAHFMKPFSIRADIPRNDLIFAFELSDQRRVRQYGCYRVLVHRIIAARFSGNTRCSSTGSIEKLSSIRVAEILPA